MRVSNLSKCKLTYGPATVEYDKRNVHVENTRVEKDNDAEFERLE